MWLSKLSLTNFRSYRRLEITFPCSPIIIRGDNARGKTNLLEAIYMTATTRSARASEEAELLSWPTPGGLKDPLSVTRITALVEREAGKIEIDIAMQRREVEENSLIASSAGDRVLKKIRVNGLAKRGSDVIGTVKAVMFCADDLDIISGSPSSRRRYLDMLLSQLERPYYLNLQHYNKLLPQRNRLLERIGEGKAHLSEIDYWDQELARSGSYLCLYRKKIVDALNPNLLAILKSLASGENGRIEYLPHTGGHPVSWELESIAGRLLASFRENREKEIGAGMTLYGPHRDDLIFYINGKDARAFASRGQRHSLAISLRLAEILHIKAKEGESPLILMDDIFTELDAARRGLVLQYILELGEQAIITTTEWEKAEVPSLSKAQRLELRDGQITPLN